MSVLPIGAGLDAADRRLTVLGRVSYEGGLTRYCVAGDPDIECIDRFASPRRERALLPIAPAEVVVKSGAALYLGAEFPYLRRSRHAPVAAEGNLGRGSVLNATIEETEYGRGAKSLLCVAAPGMTAWYLVLATEPEAPEEPAVAFARAGVAKDLHSAPRERWEGDFLTFAMCAYFSASLFHAYASQPSKEFDYWAGGVLALLLCEYFLAFAGGFAVSFRKSDLEGKPEYMMFVMIGAIALMALGVVATYLNGALSILAYAALFAGRVRAGLKTPPDRIGEFGTRGAVAILANLATLFTALFVFETRASLVMAGALYFGLIGLYEAFLMSRRYFD